MQTRLSLRPGQKGTKKLVIEYGDRLVAVRYRYDRERQRRYKTVELVVEESAWSPRIKPEAPMSIRVEAHETSVHQAIQAAGGRWNAVNKVWELEYREVVRLKLEARLMLGNTEA
ncbi:MAG: hypothetical protein HY870_13795 [Chloroflexi bacterium]|nr:hypothetical protein [Chloroflexota bacterium]